MTFVLGKDWYEDRAVVLDRLERLLAGNEEPAEEEDMTEAPPPDASGSGHD